MKTQRPYRTLYIVLAVLLVLLPLLAILQYRWIGEVSQADKQRLQQTLNRLGMQFAEDFDRELVRVVGAFQFRGSPDSPDLPEWLAQRQEESSRVYTGLVQNVYLARPANSNIELLHFDPQLNTLQTVDWPADLQPLRENLLSRVDRGPDRRQPPTAREYTNNGNPVLPISMSDGPPRFDGQRGQPGPPGPGGPGGFGRGPRQGPPPAGWIVVEFDRKVLFDDFIPALVNRHFAAHFAEYYVAIVSRSNGAAIYKSASEVDPNSLASADLRLSLFNPPFGNEPGGGRHGGGPPMQFDGGRPQPGGGRGGRGVPIALGSWDLLIKHRSGSLDAAIESVRRRNLAISFGILLLLMTSVVLVVVSSHRARALAQLQMDFVARVSHELRTPLAIIRSAAYNVANGVVTDETEVREYATMVQTEGQRLSHMVDQILTFSRTGTGRATYDIKPVRVEEIVAHVVSTMSATLSQADCKLDLDIAPDLPPVKADESALSECIQNLVSNAVKYGRTSSGVHIRLDARRESTNTVLITVADSGPGIDSADLPQIFDPFFRGKNARSDMPGSGLGLNLVSRMMDAQGGRITVESEPGKGATFTLHLAVAQEATS